VIAPRKNTVGTAKPCTANHRKVKTGYATGSFVLIIIYNPIVNSSSSSLEVKRRVTIGTFLRRFSKKYSVGFGVPNSL
jgi:hypothetical protein